MVQEYTFTISGEYAGERIDSVLSLLLEGYSRSYIQKLISGNKIYVNNNYVKKNYLLSSNDIVKVIMPEPTPSAAVAEDIPLDIVYEDDHLIVVNKAKGMVVHPAAGNLSGTLVNALLYHCGSLSVINGAERPGIVHRIDKDTSGLLVCAKSDEAYRGLQKQFSEHSITRVYRAVVYFGFDEDSGTVDAPIGRDPKNRLKMAIVNDGKRAVTHWRVRERFKGFTEIEARLETGRTHQIRVHMTSINHPLLGDEVYGNVKKHPYKTEGQMLHAGILGFVHPVTGQFMEFTSEPPDIYLNTLEKLKNK
jgi:23S rRNA pseudouridine1911/1915/1917 synthase